MAKKDRENLVWNVHVRQMMLDGHFEFAAFNSLAAAFKKDVEENVLEKLIPGSGSADNVSVPTWAARELVAAWRRYNDANGSLRLGQAFNLESTTSGAHRSLARNQRYDDWLDLAFAVEELIDQAHSKTSAIKIVAAANNRTVDQLTKALRRPTPSELARGIRKSKERMK